MYIIKTRIFKSVWIEIDNHGIYILSDDSVICKDYILSMETHLYFHESQLLVIVSIFSYIFDSSFFHFLSWLYRHGHESLIAMRGRSMRSFSEAIGDPYPKVLCICKMSIYISIFIPSISRTTCNTCLCW